VANRTDAPATAKRDLTLALSAVGAIFAGLIGTNVLDVGNSAHGPMVWADHAAVVLWVPALLLLALCAYKSPSDPRWLRDGAGVATAIAGIVTAVVLLLTGFGFTRDVDRVRLLLSPDGARHVQALCGRDLGNRIDGKIRTQTLHDDFVVFDFTHSHGCRHSLDIARADIVAVEEDPGKP
jgi:hypothetical protein